ncbi:EamA family transporter RarD [Palleronia sp. THAF1]|uniref:EamA family transporter RarD n=1 Tax=Palleronia sp. THAF1 TaxID=2587842 RepID=UPI0020C7AF14|nr:EamA family transporter RarD [Palleronia sp. THAF1]
MPSDAPARAALIGTLAMIAASATWGLSAIFYKLLAHVPAAEVLAHRTLWSAVLFAAILGLRGRLQGVPQLVSALRPALLLVAGAAMISVNWFLFIFAVQAGRVVETSMGYYIFPLVSVALGVVLFAERPGRVQIVAIALACAAVAVLILGLGVTPWISLALAITFGFYGAIKKRLQADAMVSVTAEVAVLLPLALWWLWVQVPGWGGFSGGTALLLVATGPMTALPLILFTIATQRLSLATVGVIGYLNPTLQFLCATVLFGERFTLWHAIAFALIWTALALYSGAALRTRRRVKAAVPAR